MRVCPWLSVVHHVNWRLERRTRCACQLFSTVLHAAEAGTRPRSEWHTGAMRIAMPGSAVTAPYPRRPPRLASWDRRWHSGEARRLTSLSWLLVPSAFNTLTQRFWRRLNRRPTRVADAAAAMGMGISKLLANSLRRV